MDRGDQVNLLTGSAGYIGSRLREDWDGEECDWADGRDFAAIKGREFNTVVHLAALSSVMGSIDEPRQCFQNNCVKLLNFLTRNKIRRFIFASSGGSIYGNCFDAKETNAKLECCLSPYARSKFIGEIFVRELVENHVILRIGNVYDPRMGYNSTRSALNHFEEDDPICVYGDPVRDLVSIETVCAAISRAVEGEMTGTFNIGSGKGTSMFGLAHKYAACRGVGISLEPARAGEVEFVSLNCDAAKEAGLL